MHAIVFAFSRVNLQSSSVKRRLIERKGKKREDRLAGKVKRKCKTKKIEERKISA